MRSSAICCAARAASVLRRRYCAPLAAICRCTKTASPPNAEGSLDWVDDRAQHDAALARRVIAGAAMHRRRLVPHQDVAHLPGVIVNESLLRRMRREFFDQLPRFVFRHADETVTVHRV